MKNIVFIVVCVAFCLLVGGCAGDSRSDEVVIYVSPDGNDAASGSVSRPLASLQAACSKAAGIRKAQSVEKTIVISMKAGFYKMGRPLVLTSEHSGTKEHPLVIRGEGMGKTILSGGLRLPAFEKISDDLWAIDVSGIMPSSGDIQQLYVNGVRAVRARTPNEGSLFVTGKVTETIVDVVPARSASRAGLAVQQIKIPAGAMVAMEKSSYQSPTQMIINVYHAWDNTRRHVNSFSPEDSAIYVSGDAMKPWNVMDRASQFMLENDRSFLDAPGEWFFDKRESILYYIPRKGETVVDSYAEIPSAKQLLIFEGSESGHVAHVSLENLSFQHTAYNMTWRGENPQQAAASQDAVVMADFAADIVMRDCEIAHTGNNGVWFRKGCRDCEVSHCHFHDLGIGAVKIGDLSIPENEDLSLTRNITIDNNIFQGGSRVFPTGVGVLIFHACDNRVTHNEIADFGYTGISVGWLWGYNHSPSKRNKILYNHIHHIGWGILSDMGGVYTLGPSEGTEVSNNVIHHIYSYGYGGWGLYTDEGSTGIVMENNLVYDCKSSAFHQHYGKENIIRNNIFVNQMKAQMEATRVEDHLSFTFSNNIVYYTGGKLFSMNWETVGFEADMNCYWHEGGDVLFGERTLDEWRKKTGKDVHSVIQNPQFENVETNDYRIANKSMMEAIGFKPFDYSEAGVYGDESWMELSKLSEERQNAYEKTVLSYEGD